MFKKAVFTAALLIGLRNETQPYPIMHRNTHHAIAACTNERQYVFFLSLHVDLARRRAQFFKTSAIDLVASCELRIPG